MRKFLTSDEERFSGRFQHGELHARGPHENRAVPVSRRARRYGVSNVFACGTVLVGLTSGCCAHVETHDLPTSGVALAPLVRTVKNQLEMLDRERIEKGLASLLTLEEVELELTVDVKKSAEAEGGVEVTVLKAGVKAGAEWANGQKITIRFKPTPVRKVVLPPNPAAFENTGDKK